MKRLFTVLIAVAMILSLTACRSVQETPNPPGSNGSSKPVSQEPPALKVLDDSGNSAEALKGTYSWMYDMGNGLWTGVEADSAHPLDCREFLIPMETTSDTVTLTFDVEPQDITVRCWRDVHFGNPEASGEHIDVEGNSLALKEGAYIYEICASWTGENLSAAGTAHYSFYVIRTADDHTHAPAEKAQTVDDPVTGYCGNTMTTILLDGKEYTFMGSDSVNLTDILINLKYDPLRVCRCATEFTVRTEFGDPYGVNLTQGYARCDKGQADLSQEQIEKIRQILKNQT